MAFSYRFAVNGLSPCCGRHITERMHSTLAHSSVTIENGEVTVVVTTESVFNPVTASQIEDIIRKRGYTPTLQNPPSSITTHATAKAFPHWLQGILGLSAGLAVLLLCLLGGGLPFIAMVIIGAVSSLLTLALGFRAFQRAWLAFRIDRELTMDSLFVVSICLVLGISIASLFFPFLPMMFEVGLMIFGFREIGLAIKAFLERKMKSDITLVSRIPSEIEVWHDEAWRLMALSEIKVGARIRVQPGQRIPLDSRRLSHGRCKVVDEWTYGSKIERNGDEAESFLAGVQLMVGSVPLELQVERELADSHLARMDASTQEALRDKDKEEKDADIKKMMRRILTYFIPIVFLCAILAGLLVGFLVAPMIGLSCAIAVLVSACPCVLGLVVPLSLMVGVGKAQRHGLWLMDAQALEEARSIDTVVFDLHGTLTKGEQTVQSPTWKTVDVDLQHECLGVMYHMESLGWTLTQQHQVALKRQQPLSRECGEDTTELALACMPSQSICAAMMRYIESVRLKPDEDPTLSVEMLPGGLMMKKDGHVWFLGDERILARQGISPDEAPLALGETRVFLVRDSQLMSSMILKDPLRDDALETVRQLRLQGIRVCILTGEKKREVVETYAQALEFDLRRDAEYIRSGCLPIDKKEWIAALKREGRRVVAVGDSVNDFVMLSSTLGVAMLSTADPSTRDQASIHIPGKRLKPLQFLVPVAKQTFRLIYFNLITTLTYNLVSILLAGGVLLAVGVVLSPVIGATLMVLQVALLFLITYAMHKKAVTLVTDPQQVDNKVVEGSIQAMSALRPMAALQLVDLAPQSTVQQGGVSFVATTTRCCSAAPTVNNYDITGRISGCD